MDCTTSTSKPATNTSTHAATTIEGDRLARTKGNSIRPTIIHQIFDLEHQASVLASDGFDVTEASRKLDELRTRLQMISVKHDEDTASSQEPPSEEVSSTEVPRITDSNYVRTTDVQVNVVLNQVRAILANIESRRRFLHSPWPIFMFIYEFLVLTGWGLVIFLFHVYIYQSYVEQSTWTLLPSLGPAAIVGSIASSSYALTSLYRHIANRTLDARLSTWYVIKPVIGGVAGGFVGIISSVLLNVVGASGDSAHAVFLGVAYLAGANPEFTERLTNQFRQRVLEGSSFKSNSNLKQD